MNRQSTRDTPGKQASFWLAALLLLATAQGCRPESVMPAALERPERSWNEWPIEEKPTEESLLWVIQTGEAKNEESQKFLQAGRRIYDRHCASCHGREGDSNGPVAPTLWPRPRDFTAQVTGRAVLKFRSTFGEAGDLLPTDDDLFRTISRGLTGTTMEGWADVLTPRERWQVIAYLKTFDPESWHGEFHFNPALYDPGPPNQFDFATMSLPEANDALLEQGRVQFESARCWSCHGWQARGDGQVFGTHKDQWGDPIWPQNLTNAWNFKTGHEPRDIFRTITTGVAGTVMPQSYHTLTSVLQSDLETIANPQTDPNERLSIRQRVENALATEHKQLLERLLTGRISGRTRRNLSARLRELAEGRAIDSADLQAVADPRADFTHKQDARQRIEQALAQEYQPLLDTLGDPSADSAAKDRAKHALLQLAHEKDQRLRWAMSNYLAREVQVPDFSGRVLDVHRRSEPLPTAPTDPGWNDVAALEIPVTGQLLVAPRWPAPSVNRVTVKALYNDEQLAMWFRWDDRIANVAHQPPDDFTWPTDSPIGPSTYAQPGVKDRPIMFSYRDAIEVQWPLEIPGSNSRPFFFWGQPQRPVVLWRWMADRWWPRTPSGDPQPPRLHEFLVPGSPEAALIHVYEPREPSQQPAVLEWIARGPHQPPQLRNGPSGVEAQARWENGSWTLVMLRSLTTRAAAKTSGNADPDSGSGDIQFARVDVRGTRHIAEKLVPFAIHVWDGANGEDEMRMGITSWYFLRFAQPRPLRVYLIPIAAALAAVLLELGLVLWLRRVPPERAP